MVVFCNGFEFCDGGVGSTVVGGGSGCGNGGGVNTGCGFQRSYDDHLCFSQCLNRHWLVP